MMQSSPALILLQGPRLLLKFFISMVSASALLLVHHIDLTLQHPVLRQFGSAAIATPAPPSPLGFTNRSNLQPSCKLFNFQTSETF
jgi:hypothetical protein